MAYDKIIDSAKLDGALTATADAIREKTGDTAQIQWNESTGFASAISAIESGRKVASGQFIPAESSGNTIGEHPITISGLDFQPTRVIVYLIGKYTANGATYGGASVDNGLVMIDSAGYYLASYWEHDEDADESYAYLSDPTVDPNINDDCKPKITFTSDGFMITADWDGEYNEITWYPHAYRYIALG